MTFSYFLPRANKIGSCISFTAGSLTNILLYFGKLLPPWHLTPFKALSIATVVRFVAMIAECYAASPMAKGKIRQWIPDYRAKVPPTT